jgi:hypothetical protein
MIMIFFIILVSPIYLILVYLIKRILKKIKIEEELIYNNLKWLKEH